MYALQGPVPFPQIQVHRNRCARRKVFGQRAPLAAGSQQTESRVHDLTHIHCPRAATALGRTDVRCNQRLLFIGQISWVTQITSLLAGTVLGGPHAALRE